MDTVDTVQVGGEYEIWVYPTEGKVFLTPANGRITAIVGTRRSGSPHITGEVAVLRLHEPFDFETHDGRKIHVTHVILALRHPPNRMHSVLYWPATVNISFPLRSDMITLDGLVGPKEDMYFAAIGKLKPSETQQDVSSDPGDGG